MRALEFLTESVTFSVGKLEIKDGEKYFSDPWMKKVTKPCWVCDGTGKDKYPDDNGKVYDCDYCHGKKETEEWESGAPELNVSNANYHEVLEMLGLAPDNQDYSGMIQPEQLPEIMRKLILLKNQGIDQHTSRDIVNKPRMVRTKDEYGNDKIGREGPTMYDFGRTHQQVSRYLEKLIQMIQFAQKNGATIGWG